MRLMSNYWPVPLLLLMLQPGVRAGTTVFFDGSQVASLVATGVTSDTISCEGYEFRHQGQT